MRGPASISTLAAPLNIALPTVMKHIEVLRESGLVRSEKSGRVRTCHLQPEAFATAELWIARQRAVWDGRFDRLEAYLQEIEGKNEN